METVRAHLGRRMGVSGPNTGVLMAVRTVNAGISVGAWAHAMHVSSAFIASNSGKMAQRGCWPQTSNPDDRPRLL